MQQLPNEDMEAGLRMVSMNENEVYDVGVRYTVYNDARVNVSTHKHTLKLSYVCVVHYECIRYICMYVCIYK